MADAKEEVLKEVSFLAGNTKWGGKVQVLRVTLSQADGSSRTFINKRLVFTNSGRFINLPRAGIEELLEAIEGASESEREYHEALLEDLNSSPGSNRFAHSSRDAAERRREGAHSRNKEHRS
jgi:hypothetical protein